MLILSIKLSPLIGNLCRRQKRQLVGILLDSGAAWTLRSKVLGFAGLLSRSMSFASRILGRIFAMVASRSVHEAKHDTGHTNVSAFSGVTGGHRHFITRSTIS